MPRIEESIVVAHCQLADVQLDLPPVLTGSDGYRLRFSNREQNLVAWRRGFVFFVVPWLITRPKQFGSEFSPSEYGL